MVKSGRAFSVARFNLFLHFNSVKEFLERSQIWSSTRSKPSPSPSA